MPNLHPLLYGYSGKWNLIESRLYMSCYLACKHGYHHTPFHELSLILPFLRSQLQELIPVEVEVSIPYEFHRYIIGQGGKEVRSLMKECGVSITVPPSDQQSDIIVVSGMCMHVYSACVCVCVCVCVTVKKGAWSLFFTKGAWSLFFYL